MGGGASKDDNSGANELEKEKALNDLKFKVLILGAGESGAEARCFAYIAIQTLIWSMRFWVARKINGRETAKAGRGRAGSR